MRGAVTCTLAWLFVTGSQHSEEWTVSHSKEMNTTFLSAHADGQLQSPCAGRWKAHPYLVLACSDERLAVWVYAGVSLHTDESGQATAMLAFDARQALPARRPLASPHDTVFHFPDAEARATLKARHRLSIHLVSYCLKPLEVTFNLEGLGPALQKVAHPTCRP